MYSCDVCGEEFETLTRLRLNHDPCPIEQERRERAEAIETVASDRGFEIGDRCRLVKTAEEIDVVDVEPGEDEPTVVWVYPDKADTPENRHRTPASDVI